MKGTTAACPRAAARPVGATACPRRWRQHDALVGLRSLPSEIAVRPSRPGEVRAKFVDRHNPRSADTALPGRSPFCELNPACWGVPTLLGSGTRALALNSSVVPSYAAIGMGGQDSADAGQRLGSLQPLVWIKFSALLGRHFHRACVFRDCYFF